MTNVIPLRPVKAGSSELNKVCRTKQQAFNDNWNDAVNKKQYERITKLVRFALMHKLSIPMTMSTP